MLQIEFIFSWKSVAYITTIRLYVLMHGYYKASAIAIVYTNTPTKLPYSFSKLLNWLQLQSNYLRRRNGNRIITFSFVSGLKEREIFREG